MATLAATPLQNEASPAQQDDAAGARSYLSISQAAAYLGVSRVSVWRWIRAGALPVTRLGHRTARIAEADLQRLLLAPPVLRTARSKMRSTRTASPAAEAPHLGWKKAVSSEHFVQFYEDDVYLLDAVSGYVGAGLSRGEAVLVVATPNHCAGIEERLREARLDTTAARAEGRYVVLDAAATLNRFLVAGLPDQDRFAAEIGGLVARLAEGGRPVRIFGEMVALLALKGADEAAIRLEQLWNWLQERQPFSLYCAYPLESLTGADRTVAAGDVCDAHSHVIPAESYTSLKNADQRLRTIAMLQQQAQSLETALEAERKARESAEAALRLRDEFVSIAAHELRTPVAALSAHAQYALRKLERDGAERVEQVARSLLTITGQASKLGRLVQQLLGSTALAAGKLRLEPEPMDLVVLVQSAVATAMTLSDDHTIRTECPNSLRTIADPLRLEQVLTNLLDNAVKYSPAGGTIEVVLSQVGDHAVEVAVQDCGLGIPHEKRARIFEPYFQAHDDGFRSGMGLGLYVSRQILELHGGYLRAEFPQEGGTRMVMHLPLVRSEHASQPHTSAADEGTSGGTARRNHFGASAQNGTYPSTKD